MRTNVIRCCLLAACCGLGLSSSFAQEPTAAQRVTFAENKLWLVAGPTRTATTNRVTFPGEITINTNGVFTVQNHSSVGGDGDVELRRCRRVA